MRNKISALLQYQLPTFVREDHEVFVAFVQAYYEFMEEQGNALAFLQQFRDNLDVDLASDEFIEEFIKELAVTFPKNILIKKSTLLKVIKEFYIAKGSEQSFRFLFTILYGADIDIQYPKIFLHRSSNGKWAGNDYAYITGNHVFKLNIDGEAGDLSAELEGVTSGAKAVLDTIVTTFFGNQKILILDISSYEGIFIPNEEVYLRVEGKQVTETIYGVINKISVNDGGTNYKKNEQIIITDTNGEKAKARISRIDKGPIDTVTLNSGGSGYEVGQFVKAVQRLDSPGYGFLAEIMEVDGGGAITSIRIINGGYDYSKKTVGYVDNSVGTGADIDLTGGNIGKIIEIEVYDSGINYWDEGTISISVDTEDGSGADLIPVLSSIFNEPKFYKNSDDFPSNYNRIQDSYYYQDFSYVLRADVSPHEWLQTIKRVAHPAGMKLFGSFLLESMVEIFITLAPNHSTSLSRIRKLVYEADIQPSVSNQTRSVTLVLQDRDVCTLDQTRYDLDLMKFEERFEWTIEPFLDWTIGSVIDKCQSTMKYSESAYFWSNNFARINYIQTGEYVDATLN